MKTNKGKVSEMAFELTMMLIEEVSNMSKEKETTKLQKEALSAIIPHLAEVAGKFQLEAVNHMMAKHVKETANENKKPNKE